MIRLFAAAVVVAFALANPAYGAPVAFSVRGIDDAMDIHGDPSGADLVLFVGGNQWFVLPALLAEFKRVHPEVRHIFYETLPPDILTQQLKSGGLRIDELELHVQPDVFLAGPSVLADSQALGLTGASTTYASNVLALLVARGNPKHVTSLADLGRADVRVAMPNPVTEGIAQQIRASYRKFGGAAFDSEIMKTKLRAGTTRITEIHHRQTPAWLLDGSADVAPVWYSEALYQIRIRSGLVMIAIPAADNVVGAYAAAPVLKAAHPKAAERFVDFLRSSQAQAIYRAYGFSPPTPEEQL